MQATCSHPVDQDQLEPFGDTVSGQVLEYQLTGPVLVVEAGATSAPSRSPVTTTATTRLAPLVRP